MFDFGSHTVTRAPFNFGGEASPASGYVSTDTCRGCSLCADSGPQQCIVKGSPFVILQEHCMHCGLCAESCPEGAIRLL